MTNIPHGWVKHDDKLVLVIKGQDFMRTLALLNAIGDIAESHNHHPDLTLQNYNELIVTTTTHDTKGLTDKDYKLAQEISDLINYQTQKNLIEQNGTD